MRFWDGFGRILLELEGLVRGMKGEGRLLIFSEEEEGIQLGSHAHSGVLSDGKKVLKEG